MNNISVILPFHRDPDDYFLEAIKSVVNSNDVKVKIILVDDRKFPNKLLPQFPIDHIVIPTGGVGYAKSLNIGISQVATDQLALMNSDDLVSPNRFIKQIEALKNTQYNLCVTRIKKFGEHRSRMSLTGETPAEFKPEYLLLGPYWANASLMMGTEFALKHPFKDAEMSDWIFALDNYHHGIALVNSSEYLYRQHKLQSTKQKRTLSDALIESWRHLSKKIDFIDVSDAVIGCLAIPEVNNKLSAEDAVFFIESLNQFHAKLIEVSNQKNLERILIRRLVPAIVRNPHMVKKVLNAQEISTITTLLKETFILSNQLIASNKKVFRK